MDYWKKQNELDITKWNDSQAKNYDTCGEYKYCKNCNKSKEFPCAYAYEAYNSTKPSTKKTTTTTTKTASYKTSTPKTSLKTTKSKTTTSKKTTAKKVAA